MDPPECKWPLGVVPTAARWTGVSVFLQCRSGVPNAAPEGPYPISFLRSVRANRCFDAHAAR